MLLAQKLKDVRQASRYMDVATSTVYRWMQSVQQRTWPSRTNPVIVEVIVSLRIAHPFCTCEELAKKTLKATGVAVSRQLVANISKRHGVTFKRAHHKAEMTAEGRAYAKQFLKQFKSVKRKAICIDETCCSERLLARYGWCKRGQRLTTTQMPKSWKSRSLVMACTMTRICHQTLKGAYNGPRFAAFIRSLPFPSGYTVVMDNVAFHKSSCVREALAAKGYDVLYTPAYCPDANPVENVFSVFKQAFRKLRSQNLDVVDAMDNALLQINKKSLCNMFRHSIRYVSGLGD